jgi:hypothetical protein
MPFVPSHGGIAAITARDSSKLGAVPVDAPAETDSVTEKIALHDAALHDVVTVFDGILGPLSIRRAPRVLTVGDNLFTSGDSHRSSRASAHGARTAETRAVTVSNRLVSPTPLASRRLDRLLSTRSNPRSVDDSTQRTRVLGRRQPLPANGDVELDVLTSV